MPDHLVVGEHVRVDRPRSKYHDLCGEVTAIGYDQFRSTPQQFYYTVSFRSAPSEAPVTVPYDYVRVERDGVWVTPDPLDPVESDAGSDD